MPPELPIPPRRHRRKRRALKSLINLAGGYLLTATCFWLAGIGVVQRTYGVTAVGIGAGLFFGLGYVVLTRQALQERQRPSYPPSAFSEDEESADPKSD